MYIYIYKYIYIHRAIMTEYTSSKNVSTTVFINFFSLTQCPSYSNKKSIYYAAILNYSKIA